MKLATSTNIMDFDDKRPYQIPIDVSTRACAKAGYKYVDACLCSHCSLDSVKCRHLEI